MGRCDGSALPAALLLTAMLALVGAALHLAVQTEMRLSVNCLERDRARFAADTAVWKRSTELRRALARFRVPAGLDDTRAAWYQANPLSLLDAGIPGFSERFGPWTLDLPLEGVALAPLDERAGYRSACHIEPLGVSGTPATGLCFSYRCHISGEGRSTAPGRNGIAFSRETCLFTIILARFPFCHWHLCLPLGEVTVLDPRLHLPARVWNGPVRITGLPAFRGTGQPLSGLPLFNAAFLTEGVDPASWSREHSADPRFALGRPSLAKPVPALPPPGNPARASLGLPPAQTHELETEELLTALGLPSGSGRPPPGIYLSRNGELTGGIYVEGDLRSLEIRAEGPEQVMVLDHAAGLGRMALRVDRQLGVTTVDGVVRPGLVEGPVYVEGAIHSISGRDGFPILTQDTGLTVAASGDITVTGDLVLADRTDQRKLGLYSAGRRADGSEAGGAGMVLHGPGGRLRLDAALLVGGSSRGIRIAGDHRVELFGALAVENLVQPELFSQFEVTYDSRFYDTGFRPPCWPALPSFEAYLSSWEVERREEISRYH